MKIHEEIAENFNSFLKITKGKCPIIAYTVPLPQAVKCVIDHKLASGIGYYNGIEGKEIGSWFLEARPNNDKTGPGGVKYQGYPDWEEVEPPGKPVPVDAPAEYICSLSEESIKLIKDASLFLYSFVYYGGNDTCLELRKKLGDYFIPSIVMEADMGFYPAVSKQLENAEYDKDKAYEIGLEILKKKVSEEYPYGLSGSGVVWYQGGALSKQKRWDQEIANGNFNLQAAFLRGAAQQHDIPFIIYVAPMGNSPEGLWGTKADPDTPFGKVFNCTYFAGGKPDHVLERDWYFAWFSGPVAVIMEASLFYLFKKGKDENSFDPGIMADACKKLNYLAYESDFDRGTPYRPACVLMDERHGWDMPCAPDSHNWNPPEILRRKIWGKFDYRHEDIMVDNFFGAIFPGYEWGGSFGHRKGDLVPTPYGESFDVLMSNADIDALKKYPAVFPVGKANLTEKYKTALEGYVKDGGNLVLNICQVDFEWQDFLGVKFTPKYNRWYVGLGTLRTSEWSEWLEPKILWDEERYHYSRIETDSAKILAVTQQGDPLVVRNKVGNGYVYLVTAHFMQEISGLHRPNGLLKISKFLIGHVLDPYQKIRIRGEEICYMVNETQDGLSILLLNNNEKIWNGWITVPGMKGAKIKEWYKGDRLHQHSTGNDLSIRLEIPGNGIRVISCDREK